eukprot:5151970-Pyramimonas_sp.AAC.1
MQAAMVPMTDMLDHDPAARVLWSVDPVDPADPADPHASGGDRFVVRSNTGIARGSIAFNNYGNTLDNARLLM